MTQALRVAAQALLDAIDAPANDTGKMQSLHTAAGRLRAALSAPQPTADELVADHMRLVQESSLASQIRGMSLRGGCDNEELRAEEEAALAAVEQSARALLGAAQEDASKITDTHRIEWMFLNCHETSADDLEFENPDAWRAWVDAAMNAKEAK